MRVTIRDIDVLHLGQRSNQYEICAVRRVQAKFSGGGDRESAGSHGLAPLFDVFVESSVVGLRKPDPRIYRHACDEIGTVPEETVFLDDIGRNLKPARQLGMTTIKVDDPIEALEQLEDVLGFALLADRSSS